MNSNGPLARKRALTSHPNNRCEITRLHALLGLGKSVGAMMLLIAGLLGVMAAGAAFVGFDMGGSDDDDLVSETELETDDSQENDALDGLNNALETAEEDSGDDVIAGDDSDQTLAGGLGDDSLHGYEGDDLVQGEDGDDELHGGEGNDTVEGGADNDTLHGEDGDDTLMGNDGDDQMFGHNDDDVLHGNAGDDSLVGSAGDDQLFGDVGDDALHGDLDNDTLFGGDGQDTLFGGFGNDLVVGDDDAEADFLNGGAGDDTLIGGSGDYIHSGEGSDLILIGDWVDSPTTVLDFDPGLDQIAVVIDEGTGDAPEVTLSEPDSATGEVAILVNGEQAAIVSNGADLTVSDIALIARPI